MLASTILMGLVRWHRRSVLGTLGGRSIVSVHYAASRVFHIVFRQSSTSDARAASAHWVLVVSIVTASAAHTSLAPFPHCS